LEGGNDYRGRVAEAVVEAGRIDPQGMFDGVEESASGVVG